MPRSYSRSDYLKYLDNLSLIRNIEAIASKVLSLGNKNKKILFCIPLTYS